MNLYKHKHIMDMIFSNMRSSKSEANVFVLLTILNYCDKYLSPYTYICSFMDRNIYVYIYIYIYVSYGHVCIITYVSV